VKSNAGRSIATAWAVQPRVERVPPYHARDPSALTAWSQWRADFFAPR